MYFRVLSRGSFTVPAPLRTKNSPSGAASIPFHFKNTGSGLLWQHTTHTVLPCTIWVLGSMHVPARSPMALRANRTGTRVRCPRGPSFPLGWRCPPVGVAGRAFRIRRPGRSPRSAFNARLEEKGPRATGFVLVIRGRLSAACGGERSQGRRGRCREARA